MRDIHRKLIHLGIGGKGSPESLITPISTRSSRRSPLAPDRPFAPRHAEWFWSAVIEEPGRVSNGRVHDMRRRN
jgi:hypothetical protein